MITKTAWNSLTRETRKEIASIMFHNMPEEFHLQFAEEFHHRLNSDGGRYVKAILNNCFINKKTGKIRVSVEL